MLERFLDSDPTPLEDTDHRQLLGDLHRAFGSSFELKPGMYTSLSMTFDRLDRKYGPIDDPYERIGENRITKTREKIQVALMAGEDGVEQFMVGGYQDEEPFKALKDRGTETFLQDIADPESYYQHVTENLETLGYEEADLMLRELAEEVSDMAARSRNHGLDEVNDYLDG
ncbi:MAG: hypothetical protein SVU32_04585 [Candidatus Nanohaloarchaea archaeon]|nr:hypothetical protein [Candidatus Nanohaloarchaea archaeon]